MLNKEQLVFNIKKIDIGILNVLKIYIMYESFDYKLYSN